MKNKYFEAPKRPNLGEIDNENNTIFLAGSITGAADWQKDAVIKLIPYFHIFNPRRLNYKIFDSTIEEEQISWEYDFLNYAKIILFYFSFETLAPITLLEYGAMLEATNGKTYKKVYIAIHPEYKRKNDVIIQTKLRNWRFSKNITFSLDETIDQIIKENK